MTNFAKPDDLLSIIRSQNKRIKALERKTGVTASNLASLTEGSIDELIQNDVALSYSNSNYTSPINLLSSGNFKVFDGIGATVTLDSLLANDSLIGWQAGGSSITELDMHRSGDWAPDHQTHSIYYRAKALSNGAHADLGFQWGSTISPVTPGRNYKIEADVNIVQMPTVGQACFLVWMDDTNTPIYPEIRGDVATSTGEQVLSVQAVAPVGTFTAWWFVANGGGGVTGLFNELLIGDVTEYYMGNPRLYEGGELQAWVAPTLTNGWTDLGFGFSTAGYYKDRNRVYLKGTVTPGVSSNGQSIFTLSLGYRPPATMIVPCISNGGDTYVTLNTNGTVVPNSAGWVSLDGISFRLDS